MIKRDREPASEVLQIRVVSLESLDYCSFSVY
jgi:hypothetical protein